MTKAKCSESLRVSKIKVAENGKQAVILNPNKQLFTRTKIDGCTISNQTACDWLIQDNTIASILIELKGCDVEHAIAQIEATLLFMKTNDLLTERLAALIVCSKPSRHPSFTAKLQKAKSRLSKEYKAPLHVVTGNHEYKIDRLLSHTGPH